MVLDHLVVGDELILEPDLVKAKIDIVIKGWTKKCNVLLENVFNNAFSNVMCSVSFDELLEMVSNLSDNKTAGLSGHCDDSVLYMFLVLLNSCLFHKLVSSAWKEAWVLMIPKPYKWEGVLTNTQPIALIETTCKILFKILLDRISLACSFFDVLCRDNFSVLKSTTTQSPIFAISSVIEDILEKNCELWLNSLVRIKMCNKFIRFFGNIHNDHVNRVITDFGLTNGYQVHDSLDQEKVFLLLFWCIFYDPLLCKIKRQENICKYRLNCYFVTKTGHLESQAELTFFLTAGAFVDDTIWIGSSRAAIQHILDVASKFFQINDIFINNDKTVAIPINCRVTCPNLSISGSSIFIAKREESHCYLGIFLSIEGLSKPSLVKTNTDVRFFANLVLRKTISDKQFLYLVLAVLQPIVSYRTQFSFVLISMCDKWNSLIHKGLKLKFSLSLDFPNDALYHSSLYSLKTFKQVQVENKVASIVCFANFLGILGQLFLYRSYDLQVLFWSPFHLLVSPVHIKVSASNNFLVGVVHIFLGCGLFLDGHVNNFFHFRDGTSMSFVLGKFDYFKFLPSLQRYDIAFVDQLHGKNRAFRLFVDFLNGVASFPTCFSSVGTAEPLDILKSSKFGLIYNQLLGLKADSFSVYTDEFLRDLGSVNIKAGTAVFFENISLGLGVRCQHIVNIIRKKNLSVNWHKVKGHSDIMGNKYANVLADVASLSP
ncbi:hypothetical protein G9A89_023652 [Geosiphon pyriformis]|nr:hypothetical protein G9A89_023652 [Geosiphon pyriformis]